MLVLTISRFGDLSGTGEVESYPGLDLTFGGYSQWNGRYVAVEPYADFTNATQYDIIDRSKHLWARPDVAGVLGWSSSSQFPNTWVYSYFNGFGTSVLGQITCSGQYNPDPTQCNLQSSGSGLNSITAVSPTGSAPTATGSAPTGSGMPGSAPTNQLLFAGRPN